MREKMTDNSNMVLNQLLEIKYLSGTETLQVIDIHTFEPNKFRVCYQASSNLRRQYVIKLFYSFFGEI